MKANVLILIMCFTLIKSYSSTLTAKLQSISQTNVQVFYFPTKESIEGFQFHVDKSFSVYLEFRYKNVQDELAYGGDFLNFGGYVGSCWTTFNVYQHGSGNITPNIHNCNGEFAGSTMTFPIYSSTNFNSNQWHSLAMSVTTNRLYPYTSIYGSLDITNYSSTNNNFSFDFTPRFTNVDVIVSTITNSVTTNSVITSILFTNIDLRNIFIINNVYYTQPSLTLLTLGDKFNLNTKSQLSLTCSQLKTSTNYFPAYSYFLYYSTDLISWMKWPYNLEPVGLPTNKTLNVLFPLFTDTNVFFKLFGP
jgi:hypothetical protein